MSVNIRDKDIQDFFHKLDVDLERLNADFLDKRMELRNLKEKILAPAFDTERKLSWILQVWFPKQEKPFDLVSAEQMMHELLERIGNIRGGLRDRLRELGYTGNF